MDYMSLAILIAIIIYGIVEYRRRERVHRRELAFIGRGEIPPPREPLHPILRLVSIGATVAIIIASEGILAYMWIRFPKNFTPLAVVGIVFLAILAPLIALFRGELGRYKTRSRAGRREE